MSHTITPTVFVVHHSEATRKSLEELIRACGWQPATFSSGCEFLTYPRGAGPCCLIFDVALSDICGLELQRRVAAERGTAPIIFLSDFSDVCVAVSAMKGGAFEFLTRPFDNDVIQKAIQQAIKRSESALSREGELKMLKTDYDSLTPRERDVMRLVVSGLLNKQVGVELGISEITVKAHRGNVMRKMKAESFAHLVNMAGRLRLSHPSKQPSCIWSQPAPLAGSSLITSNAA